MFFPVTILHPVYFSNYLQLLQPLSTDILRNIFVHTFWDYGNHTDYLFLDFALSSELNSFIDVIVNPELPKLFIQPNLT